MRKKRPGRRVLPWGTCLLLILSFGFGCAEEPHRAGLQLDEVPPALRNASTCRELLLEVPEKRADRIAEVQKILDDRMHWGIYRHFVFSTRSWNTKDIHVAFSLMRPDDIPILVNLLGSGTLQSDSDMKVLAIRVLSLFGASALPCVDAGIDLYDTEAVKEFEYVILNINAEEINNKHRKGKTE